MLFSFCQIYSKDLYRYMHIYINSITKLINLLDLFCSFLHHNIGSATRTKKYSQAKEQISKINSLHTNTILSLAYIISKLVRDSRQGKKNSHHICYPHIDLCGTSKKIEKKNKFSSQAHTHTKVCFLLGTHKYSHIARILIYQY